MVVIVATVLGAALLITLIVLITLSGRSVSHLHMHEYRLWTLHTCTGPKMQPATVAPLIISDLRSAPRPAALQTSESPTPATSLPIHRWLPAIKVHRPWPGCRESHEPVLIRAGTPRPTWRWQAVGKTSSPAGGTRWVGLHTPIDPAQSELWNFLN